MTDDLQKKRKQLMFRAEHRGTKEMDLLLGSFAKKHVPELTERELEEFEELLTHNDPDLYNWMIGKEEAPAMVQVLTIFPRLRDHKLK